MIGRIPLALGRLIARRAMRRPPDFVIGGAERPYLLRWFVLPRNPLLNVYVHHIKRSDDDRALHDHPWPNISMVLQGGYFEVTPADPEGRWRDRGSMVLRRASASHRLVLGTVAMTGETHECVTLFITGPRIRQWGFHCPQGWVHWKDFTAPHDKGAVGKGCDQ
jgi:hypothetical protein